MVEASYVLDDNIAIPKDIQKMSLEELEAEYAKLEAELLAKRANEKASKEIAHKKRFAG